MGEFNYSLIRDKKWDSDLLGLVAAIYKEAGKQEMYLKQRPEELEKLVEIAKIQSTEASNAIEGIVTSDERIAAIVNQNSAPLNHNEAEIAGYRDALNEIHTEYNNMDFRQSDILRLHKIMMNIAGYSYGGVYKEVDNDIIEEDKTGRRKIRFHPTSALDTKDEMEQLELAYLDARDNPNINQLLLIPCVILDFLCIHPFRDGNGRISRLLSLLLLYKNGFDAGKYISFEEQINLRKGNYYDALMESSKGWHENKQDYSAYIMEFLVTLYSCYKELDRRFAVIGDKKVTKQARVEAVVLNSLTSISKAQVSKILPDVSITTIEAVLGQMIRSGQIRKVGTGKGVRYIKK